LWRDLCKFAFAQITETVQKLCAVDDKIVPVLEAYKPDLLLLSSGFDGHKNDPTEDGLTLEEADYGYITDKMLAVADKFCGGKIVSVLEGGYNLPALRKSVKEHVVGLVRKAPSEKAPPVNTNTTSSSVATVKPQPSITATTNVNSISAISTGPALIIPKVEPQQHLVANATPLQTVHQAVTLSDSGNVPLSI